MNSQNLSYILLRFVVKFPEVTGCHCNYDIIVWVLFISVVNCKLEIRNGKKRQPNFTNEELEILTVGVEKRAKLLFGTLGGATTAAINGRDGKG